MALLLYVAVAGSVLSICHRAIRPLSLPAAVILLLLPLCFTGRALITGSVYAPIDHAYASEPLQEMRGQYGVAARFNGTLNDVASQMIPWRKAVQWSLRKGEWPLLNPFILSGDILAASGQPAAYSPFTLLACLLPVALSMTFTAAIAFFVAGLGAFLFLRETGCGEFGALVAAAACMFSSALSFFILWPLAFSWAYLPAVLLGTRRVVHAPSFGSAAILTTTLALTLLAGHPETVLHIVFIGGVYAIQCLARHRQRAGAAILAGVAAGAVALLLAAIDLLPLIEAVDQSMEHLARTHFYAHETRGATTPGMLAALATDVFPFLHMRQWLIPSIPALPIDSAAVGSIALALAAYALVRSRSSETWFLAALAIFGLLMRAGWPPLARLFQKLPLFDIAYNERFGFAAAFAMAALAGIGAHALVELWPDRRALLTFAGVLSVIAAGTFLILRAQFVGPNLQRWGDAKIAVEIGCLAVATLLIALSVPVKWALPSLMALLLVQRGASEIGVYPVYPLAAAYPPIPLFDRLKSIDTPFRVTGTGMTFIPGASALYELEDVRGYQAVTNLRYWETYRFWSRHVPAWFNRVEDLTRPFLSFLNVRFAIAPSTHPVPDGWRAVTTQRGTALFENTRVLERAFVPRFVRVGLPERKVLQQMEAETDFSERAWIEAPLQYHERPNGPGRVVARRIGSGYMLDADMEGDGWIVISNVAWHGWRPYIDGRRVKMHIANHAFVSVYVPQGKHQIRVVYRPPSFVAGRIVSLATLMGILIAVVVRRRRRGTRALSRQPS